MVISVKEPPGTAAESRRAASRMLDQPLSRPAESSFASPRRNCTESRRPPLVSCGWAWPLQIRKFVAGHTLAGDCARAQGDWKRPSNSHGKHPPMQLAFFPGAFIKLRGCFERRNQIHGSVQNADPCRTCLPARPCQPFVPASKQDTLLFAVRIVNVRPYLANRGGNNPKDA